MTRADPGWPWFEPPAAPDADPGPDLARAAARLFATRDGEAVLTHLRAMTVQRVLGPDCGDAALRHLEGQRHLVLHLHALIARGRAG